MSSPEINQQSKQAGMLARVKAKYRQLEVGSLLVLSGDSGRYQQMALFILCVIGIIESSIKFCMPYVFYQPTFLCPDPDGIMRPCPASVACLMETRTLAYEVYGINAQFGLICENHYIGVWASMIAVFNGGMFSIILVLLADCLGRKVTFVLVLMTHILGVTLLFVGQSSFIVTMTGLSLHYMACFAWYSVATLFLNESLGGTLRVVALPLIFISRSLGLLFVAFSYYFINHYLMNCLMQAGVMLILAPAYFLFFETPFYVYRSRTLADLYCTAKRIAYFNFSRAEARIRANYIFKMLFDKDNDTQVTADHVEKGLGLPIEESNLFDAHLVTLRAELSSRESATSKSLKAALSKITEQKTEFGTLDHEDISISGSVDGQPAHLDPTHRMDPVLLDQIKKLNYEKVHDEKFLPSQESNSYMDIFKINHFLRLVGIIWIGMTIFAANGLTAFSVQSIGIKSIFISGLFMGVFDLFGSTCGFLFSTVWSRKTIIMFSMSLYCFSSLSLLAFPYLKNWLVGFDLFISYAPMIESVLTFSIRFGVAFCNGLVFTYCTELFPTHLRTLSFGLFGFFGRMIFAFSEVIIDVIIQAGWNPCAALVCLAVVALPIACIMPETGNKKLGN